TAAVRPRRREEVIARGREARLCPAPGEQPLSLVLVDDAVAGHVRSGGARHTRSLSARLVVSVAAMRASYTLTFTSNLDAPVASVWEVVGTMPGVNAELAPWLRMTTP